MKSTREEEYSEIYGAVVFQECESFSLHIYVQIVYYF